MSEYVFLSHSAKDSQLAMLLRDLLTHGGMLRDSDFFFSADPDHGVGSGRTLTDDLRSKMRGAKVALALVTQNYFKSAWAMWELGALGMVEGLPLIPLCLPSITERNLLGGLQNVRIRQLFDVDGLNAMLTEVKEALPGDSQVPPNLWETHRDKFISTAKLSVAQQSDFCVIADMLEAELESPQSDQKPYEDRSFLVYLLIRVQQLHRMSDCVASLLASPLVEEVCDVYGDWDLVARLRMPTKEAMPHELMATIETYCRVRPINILWEVYPSKDMQQRAFRADSENRGIKAFIYMTQGTSPDESVDRLAAACTDAGAYGRPGARVRAVYKASSEVLAEITMTCGGYYKLERVMRALEDARACQSVSKTTLLAFSDRHCER